MSAVLPFAAFGLLAYTYAGYPLLIATLAKVAPHSTERDPAYTPSVSALIPAYNVEKYLDAKLDSLLALDYPKDKFEILIYCDGSDDRTWEILERRAAEDPRVRPIKSEARSGKPTALNVMREAARGEILLLTDARQPLVPGALRALVQHFVDESVGCVSGNLVLEGEGGAGVYWRYESWIRRNEAKFRSMVGVTGPIYAIRKKDLQPVPNDIVLDDLFTPMRLRFEGKKILFEPAAIATDDAFADEREFGRKTRTLAGNYQMFARMPGLLDPSKNPSFFETFSHKALRLAAPPLLVVCLLGSAKHALSPGGSIVTRLLAGGLFGGQAIFYAAAAAGPRAGRLAGVARSFVVFNAASVVGFWRFMKGSQRVTW